MVPELQNLVDHSIDCYGITCVTFSLKSIDPMPVLITAFGPFGGRRENASSLVVESLRKTFPDIRTRILPVDSVVAPSRLRWAIREIQPSAVIMLGEASECSTVRLETRAWNLKDFRIPDIAGRQPIGKRISCDAADFMDSTLPLREIHASLVEHGHSVSISDDPGRYLCNQLFYTALDFLKTNRIRIPAGFIHLPLETNFSTDRAVGAVSEIIKITESESARHIQIS